MDEGILRQRRNLVTISIIIIIFYIAGGSFKSILGVSIKNPEYIEYFLSIAFMYLLWRYWLYSKGEISYLLLQCVSSPDGEEKVKDVNRLVSVSISLKQIENKTNLFIEHTHHRGGEKRLTIRHAVPNETPWIIFFKSFVKLALTGKQFSDYALPYIIACFAFIIMLANLTTR